MNPKSKKRFKKPKRGGFSSANIPLVSLTLDETIDDDCSLESEVDTKVFEKSAERDVITISDLTEKLRVSDLYKNAENVTFTLPVSSLLVEHFYNCTCGGYSLQIWIHPGVYLGLPFPYPIS
ncbi:hypothetical protein EIN_471120, partial [Entamoeba invadens IP1]